MRCVVCVGMGVGCTMGGELMLKAGCSIFSSVWFERMGETESGLMAQGFRAQGPALWSLAPQAVRMARGRSSIGVKVQGSRPEGSALTPLGFRAQRCETLLLIWVRVWPKVRASVGVAMVQRSGF